MERIELLLDQLTQAQKLEIMETLWEDLTRDEKPIESPAWHEAILKDREEAYAAGKVKVFNWEEAKERIKRNVACK